MEEGSNLVDKVQHIGDSRWFIAQCVDQFGKQKICCCCSAWYKWKRIVMGKPLDGIMGSCFVGSWVVANKIAIVLHCRANIEGSNTFVIPLCSVMIKKYHLGTNGCYWSAVVIKCAMDLVVC